MKKVANTFLSALILCCFFISTNAQSNIIGNAIKIGSLEVAQHNYSSENWEDAKKKCSELGSGWRLPTVDELTTLFQNKDKIGNISPFSSYWTSKVDIDEAFAVCGWGEGYVPLFSSKEKSYGLLARAVRNSINNSENSTVQINGEVKSNKVSITVQNNDNSKKSECMVIENTKKPNLNYTIIDNRELCICCRERYKRFVLSDLEDKKSNQEVQYLNARLEEHLSKSSADENHIESDRAKLKGYIILNYGMIGLTGSVLVDVLSPIVDLFGGSTNKISRDREIDKYRNISDYCSKKCEILCSR